MNKIEREAKIEAFETAIEIISISIEIYEELSKNQKYKSDRETANSNRIALEFVHKEFSNMINKLKTKE